MNLSNYVRSAFKGLRDILGHIKSASESAIIRLFTQRKTRYDALLHDMRSFQAVLSSDDGVTEIDVSGRRSGKVGGKDVKLVRFQDGIALPVADFMMPNRQELAKDVKLLDEADEYVQELEAMIVRLSKRKDAGSRKIVKEMKSYVKQLEEQIDNVLDKIQDISDKHMPSVLSTLSGALIKHVNDTLPSDTYDEIAFDIQVTSHDSVVGKKSAPVEFTYYLHIDGLDKDQFGIDEFIIALTGIVNEVRTKGSRKPSYYMTVHLTSMNKYQSPGHFDPGPRIGGTSLNAMKAAVKREANKLLAMHGLAAETNRIVLKDVTQQKLRNSALLDVEGVLDLDVVNDQVVIEIAPMRENVVREELWPEVIVILRKLVRLPREANFVYTLEREGRKRVMRVTGVKSQS